MKHKQQPVIVGAGLAGLIAAHAWPQAPILEAASAPRPGHRALLRFRSEAVANLTGIEFRRVRVRKGIWAEGRFAAPAICWANQYAQKVVGRLAGERSIWNVEAVDRFVAPETFYEQLIEAVGHRVSWETPAVFNPSPVEGEHRPLLISTAPLPVVLSAVGIQAPCEFPRAPIRVTRWRVPGADVFQTVYFPERSLSVYRASITGETLIVESVMEPDEVDLLEVERAFGIDLNECELLESVEQKYGKIAPIDDATRKGMLFRLTHEHNIYSLGRFATWRNVLLDDVVEDISVIKRLLTSRTAYDAHRSAA